MSPSAPDSMDPQDASYWRVGLPVRAPRNPRLSQALADARWLGVAFLLSAPLTLAVLASATALSVALVARRSGEARHKLALQLLRPLEAPTRAFEGLVMRASASFAQIRLVNAIDGFDLPGVEHALSFGADPLRPGANPLAGRGQDAFDALARAHAYFNAPSSAEPLRYKTPEQAERLLSRAGPLLRAAVERRALGQSAPVPPSAPKKRARSL